MLLSQSVSKNSLLLGLYALIAAGVLAGTFLLTKDRIEIAERAAAERALYEIIPADQLDNNLLNDTMPVPDTGLQALGLKTGGEIYRARREQVVTAVILPAVAPDGYSGDIAMRIGVNRDGSLTGVRIVSHRETPGLGDKMETNKGDWVLSFEGKSLDNPTPERWSVKKEGGDFDQFTGATITPRAIVHQVRRALEFVEDHRELLFPEIPEESAHE